MSINYKTFGQGNFKKTSSRSGKFTGPKHSNGGIKTADLNGNMIEVEGGESVGEVNTNIGKQPYIYSQYVKRHGGVSYADEFDKMVSRGAPQQELDMLAAEQDSKAERTGGSVQVTPMQFQGGGLPDEIFPGVEPTFAFSLGWGGGTGATDAQGNPTGGGGFTMPGLSGDTWKYLGNEAYKYTTGAARRWGEEIEDFGQSALKKGKNWIQDLLGLQEGGLTNNINNNTMTNRLSKRVMQHDSRYRNGGILNYQGDGATGITPGAGDIVAGLEPGHSYTGKHGDFGPEVIKQQEEAVQARKDRGESTGNWFSKLINTLLYLPTQAGQTVTMPGMVIGDLAYDTPTHFGAVPFSQQSWNDQQGYWSQDPNLQPPQPNPWTGQYGGVPNQQNNTGVAGYGMQAPQAQLRNPYGYGNTQLANMQPQQFPAQYQGGGFPWQNTQLSNRILKYQGGQHTGIVPTAVSNEENQQWESFMASDAKTQQKSPTRRDIEEEFIRKVLESAPYNPKMY